MYPKALGATVQDFFDLSAPPRRHAPAVTTSIDVLHTLDIEATAQLLARMNQQSELEQPVLIQDPSAVDDPDGYPPWSPTRLLEALQLLRMRPELETFRCRGGATWFRINAATNPDLTDPDQIGDVLADARRAQLEDLTLEAGILCDLGEYSSHRATVGIPSEKAAIACLIQQWETRGSH